MVTRAMPYTVYLILNLERCKWARRDSHCANDLWWYCSFAKLSSYCYITWNKSVPRLFKNLGFGNWTMLRPLLSEKRKSYIEFMICFQIYIQINHVKPLLFAEQLAEIKQALDVYRGEWSMQCIQKVLLTRKTTSRCNIHWFTNTLR